MKKIAVIVFLSGILLVVSSVYVVFQINYSETKEKNKILVEKINEMEKNNTQENDNNSTLNDSLSKLEEEKKEQISEYNLWVELKEKLTSILSS